MIIIHTNILEVININPKTILVINIIIGVIIALSPIIITGRMYNETNTLGTLLITEFIIRTLSLIIGLLVIYNSIKNYSK